MLDFLLNRSVLWSEVPERRLQSGLWPGHRCGATTLSQTPWLARVARCPPLNRIVRFWGELSCWKFQLETDTYRYIHMFTDPDPEFLAPARSSEIGQDWRVSVSSTCRPGNPIVGWGGDAPFLTWQLVSMNLTALSSAAYNVRTDINTKNLHHCRQ